MRLIQTNLNVSGLNASGPVMKNAYQKGSNLKGASKSPQFGLCPVCWTVGGMALLGGIPLVGGLLKKLFVKKPKPPVPCQTTGDTFCQCTPPKNESTK
jgi:hypothetical protein